MSWPWIVWWLAIFVSFAILERYAFKHPDRENTLSRVMSNMGQFFPLSIGIVGLIVGSLMTHFFWHFCPGGTT